MILALDHENFYYETIIENQGHLLRDNGQQNDEKFQLISDEISYKKNR